MKSYRNVIICSLLPVFFLFAETGRLDAQNTAGIVTDNYAGVNRSFINPAAVTDSPFCLHFNFLTIHGGVQNNYLYIPRGEMGLNLVNNWQDIFFRNPRQYLSKHERIAYANGNQYGRIQGPSVSLQLKEHTFFILTSLRMGSSLLRFPSHILNYAATNNLLYIPQQNMIFSESRFGSLNTASWLELGFGYGYNIVHSNDLRIALGISARPMWGLHGASFQADDLTYRINNDNQIHLMMLNANFQGSLPIDYTSQKLMLGEDFIKGRGFAFDAGISYTRKKDTRYSRRALGPFGGDYNEEYLYRIGFSILDIGYVLLKRNTTFIDASGLKGLWSDLDWIDSENIFQTFSDFDEVFPEEMSYSGEIVSSEGESFMVYLPAAASVQLDYSMGNNLFTYLLWVHDIPYSRRKISSTSYIGIIPRYETRKITIALPFTFYEYSKPRLGISFRYGFVTIGSEQLGGILNINDASGADLYVSLHWGLQNCNWKQGIRHPCQFITGD